MCTQLMRLPKNNSNFEMVYRATITSRTEIIRGDIQILTVTEMINEFDAKATFGKTVESIFPEDEVLLEIFSCRQTN